MSEKVGTCQYESWGDRICYRDALPESEDHYCICHEQSNDKDIESFNEEIERIMEKKEAKFYDFEGFYFPEKFDFGAMYRHLKDRVFNKKVNFSNVIFKGVANFADATFQEADFTLVKFQLVNFADATFQKVDFRAAKFQHTNFRKASFQWSNFGSAIFQGEANFERSTFQKAYFNRTVFEKKADFENCEIEEKIDFQHARFHDEFLLKDIRGSPIFDFRNTVFSDKTWIGAGTNLHKALFSLSRAELVDFTGAEFPEKLYEEQLLEKKELNDEEKKYCPKNWEEVSAIYRKLKQAHQRHGDYTKAGEFYYREMECKKKALREKRFSLDWFKSCGYSFLKHSCGYGEKPLRVMRNSLISVLGFAFAYFFTNSINLSGNSVSRNILQSIYFSTITFTTLGYGDIHPINDVGRVLAMSEAVLGAIFIALFIFVFGRKMMR